MEKRMLLLVAICTMLLLVGCNQTDQPVELAQFVGGSSGVSMEFVGLRADVFDGGNDPFDLVIRINNVGEHTIDPNDLTVEIKGIQPEQFGKSAAQLTSALQEELTGSRLDAGGNALAGGFSVIEFTELVYGGTVPGQTFEAPIKAEACYAYSTTAVSTLCVVENLLSPSAGSTCSPSGAKTVSNSGAPVHVENFRQSVLGRDKIEFTFDVVHVGTGSVYAPADSVCATPTRPGVKIRVDTALNGLTCTGFDKVNTAAEKVQSLPVQSNAGGVSVLAHTVRCTQQVREGDEFEFPVRVDLNYMYEDVIESKISVKKSLN